MSRKSPQTPLLLRYAESIPPAATPLDFRYSYDKQISEASLDGSWVDAADLHFERDDTKLTEVRRETTDDE